MNGFNLKTKMDFEEIIKTWCSSRDLKQDELMRKSHSFSTNQLQLRNEELEQFYKVMELNHWFEKESRLSQFLIEKLFDENVELIKELDEKKKEIQQLKDEPKSIKNERDAEQTRVQTETTVHVQSKSLKKLNEKIEAFKKRLSKERQRSRHLSKQTKRLSRCLQTYLSNLKPKRRVLLRKEKATSSEVVKIEAHNNQTKEEPRQEEDEEEEEQKRDELSARRLGIDLSMEDLRLDCSEKVLLEVTSTQNSLIESQNVVVGNSSLYDDDAQTNLSQFLFRIEIVQHDTARKFIRIENKMNTLIDVGDWMLVSYLTKTSSAPNDDAECVSEKNELFTYKFHFASSIRAKSKMTLWSVDAEAAKHRPPSDFIMFKINKSHLQENIWSFERSKRGAKQFLTDVLYDSNGNVIHLFFIDSNYLFVF